ncbi:beta-1,6-N-acetylglucosaminyltransferase [Butyrivibrio sp. WCD3002]|uniref:beta-1,6-N-acetylglucosaminyltransferase n=1 Tax=Butyrivibrio sp. WCD3002 TaxID=1280676 RepID=UPI0012DDDD42|nr:beta-1,6-N-acetylglucosaminyltransferase [Butyrivibrio sp. WCD3002]
MSDKHAYLIMAHSYFDSLRCLLSAIDDARNDIYLHIDKKATNVQIEEIKTWVKEAAIFIVPRLSLSWGHSSIVKCELMLLEQATQKENYHYYHLISGVDFPLKSQNEIHDALRNSSDEYISFFLDGDQGRTFIKRIKYYYPFMRFEGKANPKGTGLSDRMIRKIRYINRACVEKQEKLGVNRLKKSEGMTIVKGDQWFSITDDLARYFITRKKQIMKMAFMTDCPDEIVLATAAYNSIFRERLSGYSLRKIDWNRGRPYEFRDTDLDELLASGDFFGRKIIYEKTPGLVKALMESIDIKPIDYVSAITEERY